MVAHMNFSSDKPDSVVTSFTYDAANNLTNETSKGYKVDRSTQYELVAGRVTRKYFFDNNKQQKYDSLTYYPSGQVFQIFHSKSASVTTYKYSATGKPETQQENAISDTNMIYNFSKYYYNSKNTLVKEIEGFSWNGKNENLSDEEYQYVYDEKNLLKEIKHIRKNAVINTEKFYYTFW